MIAITLPDGSKREFEAPVTVADVAASIGAGLAKAALAGRVDGKLVDTSFLIEKDASLAIITAKDAEALELIRHSTAHLMAQAVKQLYPEAQVTIGPAIDNGFYYDFSYKRPFTPEDLEAIEARMHEIVKQDLKVERSEMKREDAVEFFRGMGEAYKAELVEAIPEGEVISLYRQASIGPGTAKTSRPCSSAVAAVISAPLFSGASTTRAARDSPERMRFRTGKCPVSSVRSCT